MTLVYKMKRIYKEIDVFVEAYADSMTGGRANLNMDGFSDLYVRIGRHNINGEYCKTLDIARIAVVNERKGTFTRFLAHCEKLAIRHKLGVFVECVQNPHLEAFLSRNGYFSDGAPLSPSFGKSFNTLHKEIASDQFGSGL